MNLRVYICPRQTTVLSMSAANQKEKNKRNKKLVTYQKVCNNISLKKISNMYPPKRVKARAFLGRRGKWLLNILKEEVTLSHSAETMAGFACSQHLQQVQRRLESNNANQRLQTTTFLMFYKRRKHSRDLKLLCEFVLGRLHLFTSGRFEENHRKNIKCKH